MMRFQDGDGWEREGYGKENARYKSDDHSDINETEKMVNHQLLQKSKKLSWLLRHGASAQGLSMDKGGWMEIEDLLTFLDMSMSELELIVNTNDKHRFQLDGNRIRACQGHSTDNHAITREALEASWDEYTSDDSIWHGTTVNAIESIGQEGILPIQRTHVHCAPNFDSTVGKRTSSQVILEISPVRIRKAGLNIFVASNGVVLVRQIPPEAIINLVALTKRARQQEYKLREYLKLPH